MSADPAVIVIGGGLAGCATAYYLAADGVSVMLLESGDLNTLASGSNAGSLHAQIPHEPFVMEGDAWARNFAPTIKLFSHSIEMWRGLREELDADLEVALAGGLLAASSQEQMREIERKSFIERSQGLQIEILDRSALRTMAPYLSGRMVGGAFCPNEGKASPLAAAPAFAAAARRRGARIHCGATVTGLRAEGGGFAVETSAGLMHSRRIVNAAGSDAGHVAAMLGINLPVESYPIQVSVTEPIAPLVPHLVYYAGARLTLKQTRFGSLLIGGGWPSRYGGSRRAVVDPLSLAANLSVAMEVVPALASVSLLRTWAAVVNGTADWLPILGEIPREPGFFVNFVPWMGFTAGPAAARIVASLVQGHAPPVDFDLTPFLPRG